MTKDLQDIVDELVASVKVAERTNHWTEEAEEHCLELFRLSLAEENPIACSAVYHLFRHRVESWIFKKFGYDHPDRNRFRDHGFLRFYNALHGDTYNKKSFKSYKQVLVYWRKVISSNVNSDFTRHPREVQFIDLPEYKVNEIRDQESNINDPSDVDINSIEARIRDVLSTDEFAVARLYYMYRFKPSVIRKHITSIDSDNTLRVILQRIKRKLRNDPQLIRWAKTINVIEEDDD